MAPGESTSALLPILAIALWTGIGTGTPVLGPIIGILLTVTLVSGVLFSLWGRVWLSAYRWRRCSSQQNSLVEISPEGKENELFARIDAENHIPTILPTPKTPLA